MTIAIVTRISKAMKFIFCNIDVFNCNKHLNTFNMIAGLEFKLAVRQIHKMVLFFIAYCFNYEFLEV